jgi:UDPglucose--hexose-1-phosphate uridylyltransferase
VRKTERRLADGRQIFYYDATASAERTAEDKRHLSPVAPATQLRYEPLMGTWVMYASHRQDRSYLPAAEDCPLCPTRPGHPTEVPESDYEVVVFENRFPSLAPAPPGTAPALLGTAPLGFGAPMSGTGEQQLTGILGERPGGGRCEVVCYTADHSASFADLTPDRVGLVLDALTDRTLELSERQDVAQVFCFENRGREIGVTQPHPHGQIYAYPFVTPKTQKALASLDAYSSDGRGNLFDDLLAAERSDGARLVVVTDHWTAFVPYAARWPYELHCYPNVRVPNLVRLGGDARAELPSVLLDIYGRFARLFDEPAPYIAGWHQAPVKAVGAFALHLELFTVRRANDKLKYPAGSESGMGAFANDIVPEAAAARLRDLAT